MLDVAEIANLDDRARVVLASRLMATVQQAAQANGVSGNILEDVGNRIGTLEQELLVNTIELAVPKPFKAAAATLTRRLARAAVLSHVACNSETGSSADLARKRRSKESDGTLIRQETKQGHRKTWGV